MGRGVAPPRKKACGKCSSSKVRCDLKLPSCSRCRAQDYECVYTHRSAAKPGSRWEEEASAVDLMASLTTNKRARNRRPSRAGDLQLQAIASSSHREPGTATQGKIRVESPTAFVNSESPENEPLQQERGHDLSFNLVDLVKSVDEYRLRTRWLESLLPSTDQRPKPYKVGTMVFISRVLKTYPSMFVDGGQPPFIHWSQMSTTRTARALANCKSIASMWTSRSTETAEFVRGSIRQEMTRIYDRRADCGHVELLATFQAFLLYAIMLFAMAAPPAAFDADIIMNLQNLAGDCAAQGTICPAEVEGARPDWESWIIVSAKRRTLFASSLFDNLVNFTSGSPSFVAVELASLPAPASRNLWSATDRTNWQQSYNKELSHWVDGPLLISDLWPQPLPITSAQLSKIERWLLGVDDFGMAIYAVTSHTFES